MKNNFYKITPQICHCFQTYNNPPPQNPLPFLTCHPSALILDDVLADILRRLLVESEFRRLFLELLNRRLSDEVSVNPRSDVRRLELLVVFLEAQALQQVRVLLQPILLVVAADTSR